MTCSVLQSLNSACHCPSTGLCFMSCLCTWPLEDPCKGRTVSMAESCIPQLLSMFLFSELICQLHFKNLRSDDFRLIQASNITSYLWFVCFGITLYILHGCECLKSTNNPTGEKNTKRPPFATKTRHPYVQVGSDQATPGLPTCPWSSWSMTGKMKQGQPGPS